MADRSTPVPTKRRARGEAQRNEEALRSIALAVLSANRFDPKDVRERLDRVGDILVEGGWL